MHRTRVQDEDEACAQRRLTEYIDHYEGTNVVVLSTQYVGHLGSVVVLTGYLRGEL